MKNNSMMWLCYALFILATVKATGQKNNSQPWMHYQNSQDAGFNEEKLSAAKVEYDKMRSASLMIIHKGNVVVAWGDVSRRFMTHSMRKSMMSAMYGIYQKEGKVNLNQTLRELKIDDINPLSELEKDARVMDLITARSGVYHPAAYEPRSMKNNRPERGISRPGEAFFYNNWDFNTLHTILEQEARIDFFEEFINRIALPTGMEDLRPEDMRYRSEKNLSKHPAYLFKMSTRDLARFGQLYLNDGKWADKEIVPEKWVRQSTSTFTKNPAGFPDRSGYGYLWWTDDVSFDEPAYYASGLGGHVMYIFPQSDLVIAHRVNSYLNQSVSSDKIKSLVNSILQAKTSKAKRNPTLKPLKVNKEPIKKVSLSDAEFSKFVRHYNHPFFGEISASSQNGNFYVKGEILGSFRILPISRTQFVVEDLPELPLNFEPSSSENPPGKSITEVDARGIPRRFIMYY